MATNKHAMIRYQTLDKCFRNPGRKYYIEDLVEACNKSINEFSGSDIGIQKRQIYEDIKFMESQQGWNIPLDHCRDGHKTYFRYSDRSFSINGQPLNEMEENQLKLALQTLSRFKGMPQFEWVDELTARLDSALSLSGEHSKIIEFDQNNYLQGLEFIGTLYNAILYQKTIVIEYKSFKQEAFVSINFYPYFLKQYNNRWYVFGLNDETDFILNLALDRIIKIKDSRKKYIPNTTIDFNEYFEDIIGVTVDNNPKVQKILLSIKNSLYPYLKTKPIHGSQKEKEKTVSHTIISLELIPNYELESLILSFGEGVEVLEPKSLRNKIKKRIELLKNNYQD